MQNQYIKNESCDENCKKGSILTNKRKKKNTKTYKTKIRVFHINLKIYNRYKQPKIGNKMLKIVSL